MKSKPILAIDPGRDKIGMAVVEGSGRVLDHRWVLSLDFDRPFMEMVDKYGVEDLILGDKTGYKSVLSRIQLMKPTVSVHLVDESFSTLEARGLYWNFYSPSTLRDHFFRLIRIPAGPWDDITAIVLAQRYLRVQ